MPRPSFQFYPADWHSNAKLRRCSHAARGAWIDIMCVLNDSEQYGAVRWPLKDLAQAAGVPLRLARELADKEVLKGGDAGPVNYTFTPYHAGKHGTPVTLIEGDGPCWYSSRMVRDEWIRKQRGKTTRYGDDNPPPKAKPKVTPDTTPKVSPIPPFGDQSGYGLSSSSSSSVSSSVEDKSSTGAAGANVVPFSLPDKPEWWPARDCYGRVLGEITDKLLYQVGKAVLGNAGGGLITRLKKCRPYNRDMRAAVELLLRAHDDKADPKAWFMAALIRAEEDEPLDPLHVVYPEQVYGER